MKNKIIKLIDDLCLYSEIKSLFIMNINNKYKTGLISFKAILKNGIKIKGNQIFRYDQKIQIY